MIQRVAISQFQSHSETDLEFGPGVNILVGPSDEGKSAVLRAIRWVLDNKPAGNAFHRNGGKNCGVEVEFDDCIISRERDGDSNLYTLTPSGSEQATEFTAFGQNVPDQIKAAHRMSELNIEGQFDGHFMLASGDSEVARMLNSYVNLENIDRSIARVNEAVRTNTTDIKYATAEEASASAAVDAFIDVDALGELVQHAETVGARLEQSIATRTGLAALLCDITAINTVINGDMQLTSVAAQHVAALEAAYATLTAAHSDFVAIDGLLDEICAVSRAITHDSQLAGTETDLTASVDVMATVLKYQEQFAEINDLLDAIVSTRRDAAHARVVCSLTNVCMLDMAWAHSAHIAQLLRQFSELTACLSSIAQAQRSIEVATQDVERAHAAFDEAFPDVCPLCGMPS